MFLVRCELLYYEIRLILALAASDPKRMEISLEDLVFHNEWIPTSYCTYINHVSVILFSFEPRGSSL